MFYIGKTTARSKDQVNALQKRKEIYKKKYVDLKNMDHDGEALVAVAINKARFMCYSYPTTRAMQWDANRKRAAFDVMNKHGKVRSICILTNSSLAPLGKILKGISDYYDKLGMKDIEIMYSK